MVTMIVVQKRGAARVSARVPDAGRSTLMAIAVRDYQEEIPLCEYEGQTRSRAACRTSIPRLRGREPWLRLGQSGQDTPDVLADIQEK